MTSHTIDDGQSSTDRKATCFAEAISGIYRRIDVESVWKAIQFAVENQLPAENPTIMMMFIRITEVYPQVREHLLGVRKHANQDEELALQLILDPPEGLRNAEYLPETITSPGEMDLCWSEFLVTGSIVPIEKVVAVLDQDDRTRPLMNKLLRGDDSPSLKITDVQLVELASIGVALGQEDGKWKVVSPGDLDVLLWFGVKDQKPTCIQILKLMPEEDRVHLATKGAALWSLKANASQHGTIRLFCEEQSKIEGGRGRLLINPTET